MRPELVPRTWYNLSESYREKGVGYRISQALSQLSKPRFTMTWRPSMANYHPAGEFLKPNSIMIGLANQVSMYRAIDGACIHIRGLT